MGLTVSTITAPRPPQFKPPSDPLAGVTIPSRDDPEEKKIAEELRKRFLEWQEADSEWLRNALFELAFLDNHWVQEENGRDVQLDFAKIGRAAFNIDMLSPAIDLMVNQARVSKITANFIPIAEGADQATADIRQGLYRNIERVSKGAIARETAYQFAVSVGRGYERILIEDEPGPTMRKRIGMRRVDDLESIAIDPTVLDFNYADAVWGYAFTDMWRQEFEETFGEDVDSLDTTGVGLPDSLRDIWFPKDKVRVGEYWRKVWKRRTVLRLADGSECWEDEAPQGVPLMDDGKPNVLKKMDFFFEWRKMTGTQTLEKRIWPGKYVPIVVFIGREVFRGRRGKIHRGMIRPAIDPSRIYDVMFSRMVDEVGLSPLPHLFAPEGSLSEPQKAKVNEINRHTWSVITYTVKMDGDGRQYPPPQWVSPSPNTAAVVQACQMATDNLDRVLNTYAPNRGQAIADQSGKAIREIKDSGDLAHANLPDNFNRAILHEATIINDLMDFVYTDKQAITITQPDEKTTRIIINAEYQDEQTGRIKKHLFGAGKFGVAITAGQTYPNAQREAAAKLLELAHEFPNQMAQVLYLLIDDLNVPNAAKYKQVLAPPGVKEGDDGGPSVPQLTQQIQSLTQLNDQAHGIIQKLIDKVNQLGDTNLTKRLEIASRKEIAAAGDRTTLTAAAMKQGHEAAMAVMNVKLEAILAALEAPDDQDTEKSVAGQSPALPPPQGPALAPAPQLP